jgi:hypothetical protein
MKLVQHVMRIHYIANGFGHFLAFLVIDKAMGKDRFGERNLGRHEQTRPNDGMEPQNVFSDNVHVGRPKLLQVGDAAIGIDSQSIHSGQIIRQGVNPNVHDVIVGKAFGGGNAPFECGSTNGQISQGIRRQSCQYLIAMLFGTNKVWIVLNMFHQAFVIGRHFEKVGFFFDAFEWEAGCWIFKFVHFGFGVSHKGFFANIVPTAVTVQINVSIGMTALPQFAGGSFVPIARGTNVIIIRDQNALIERLKASNILYNSK